MAAPLFSANGQTRRRVLRSIGSTSKRKQIGSANLARAAQQNRVLRSHAALRQNHYTMKSGFQCAGCGEWNETFVDPSNGSKQSYVEDCQICCKANMLRIEWYADAQEFAIAAELE